MNDSIPFHVRAVLQIDLYVLARLIGADGNAILLTKVLLCPPVTHADPLFNSALFNCQTLFNSHKTAKFQNTLADAAVHLAITDEVL
jgi:hypothetical protein